MTFIEKNLPTYFPVIVDFISTKVQEKSSPEMDKLIRVGAEMIKAGGNQLIKEFLS